MTDHLDGLAGLAAREAMTEDVDLVGALAVEPGAPRLVVADIMERHVFGDGAPAMIYRDGHPSGDDDSGTQWWWKCQLGHDPLAINVYLGGETSHEAAVMALELHHRTHHRCTRCNGTGRASEDSGLRKWSGDEPVYRVMVCSKCGGTGVLLSGR